MHKLILVFALMCGVAVAQDPTAGTTPTADPAQAQVAALFAADAGSVLVPSGPASGTPASQPTTYEAVFGNLGSGGDTETVAKAFVTSYGKILNFPDGPPLAGDVTKFREWSGDDGKLVVYAPTNGGRAYLPGAVTFVFKPSGALVGVIGRYKPVTGAVGNSTTPEQAQALAIAKIEEMFPETRGQVTGGSTIATFLSDNWLGSGVEPVYHCEFTVGNPPMPKRALIEGSVGVVILVEDGGHRANSAHIFEKDAAPVYGTVTRDLEDLVEPPGFFDDWTINGTHFKVGNLIPAGIERAEAWTGWFNDNPLRPNPNPCFSEEMIYYHLTEARKKILTWGGTADLAQHDPLYFNHYVIPRCGSFDANSREEQECEQRQSNQAWFNPGDMTLNFAARNPAFNGKNPAYDATVIYHEYGHFVHKMLSEHFLLGASSLNDHKEAAACAEAFADVLSGSISNQPKIAEWLASNVEVGGRTRDLSRNLETLRTVDDVTRVRDPEPHDMAAAFATTVWKLRRDGTLSADETIKTMIAGMRLSKLPCTFRNSALAFLAADRMLAGTPHTAAIGATFHAQGLVPALKVTP